jgi:hypothetical protein
MIENGQNNRRPHRLANKIMWYPSFTPELGRTGGYGGALSIRP